MNQFSPTRFLFAFWLLFTSLFIVVTDVHSQALDVSGCPMIVKRNNGNGQYARSAGTFPGYGQTNAVANNVVGTSYQTVSYNPSDKTGSVNFKWSSSTVINNLPVITRVWLTADGASSGTLSAIKFGPPPPPVVVGQDYYVDYSFYGQNMPPAGKVTLEFTDPQTNKPSFRCTFDLKTNGTTTEPTIDCSPTITTQPSNQSICGASTATFTVAADGSASIQWQVSNDGVSSWSNISNGGDYSGATGTTLTISNPTSYDGKYYRAVVTGNSGCGNTNSNAALLIAKPKPTAVFTGSSNVCGTGTRSMGVTLTGTGPWSITYTSTPSGGGTTTTTKTNISSSPFYFSVSPSGTTTYAITSVSDAYCTNSSPSGNVSVVVNAAPSITPTNATTCYGNTSFSLSYTSTGSADKYTLSAGVRAMPGFSTITNASLSASPLAITIPGNVPAGVYDFTITVTNSTTGCTSAAVAFTVTVATPPTMTATAGSGTVCAGTNVTLTAAPSGLASYSWTIPPSATVVATGVTPTVTINSNTTYRVTGTDANGCSSTADVSITTTAGPSLSITPSAPTICSGNSTTLTASGGNTYSWSPSTGLSATTGATVVASPTTTTTYTVTSANSIGCQSVGTVTVTVNTPSIGVTGSTTICAGASKTLTATGGTSYSWYPSTGLSATTGATVTATPSLTTTYYVVGTDGNGCSAIGSSTVTISPPPVDVANSVGNTYSFCASSTSSFTLPVVLTGTITSATWSYASSSSGPYTNLSTGATSMGSGGSAVTFTVASSGLSNTLTVSGYSNGGYGGARYLRLTIVTPTCSYNYDITLYDIKGSGTAPTPVATKSTVCSGETTTLSIGGLNSSVAIQWQSASTVSGTYSNIQGATSSTYTTGALTNLTNNFFKAVLSTTGGGGCSYTTSAVSITVAAAAASNTVSPTTSCTDGSSTITLTGSSISGGTYQWQSSTNSSSSGFSDILGAVSQNYTLPNTTVASTTWFRRIATAGSCSSTTSSAVAVYAPLANNQVSNSVVSYCTTASATTLSGTTPVGGDGTYTYQWQSSTDGSNFNNIVGATSQNYTTSSQTQNYWYRRVVTSGGCSSTSGSYKITVNTPATVTVSSGSTVCAGTAVSLTASGAVTYSWSPSTELSATTGATVTATPTSTRTYTVTGTDGNGCTNTANVTITVNANPATPVVSSASKTICSGSSADLTALVTSGGTTEWYTAPVVNASYKIASPSSVSTAGTYYVFATNGSCYSTGYATVTLSVSDVTAPTVAATSLSYCSPATADLTALQPAAPAGVTYEWHTASSGPSGGNLVASPSSVSSGTYYLYAYSSAGACYGTASSGVTVTINSVTDGSVSATTASACAPSTIDLTALNNTNSPGSTFRWYSTNNPIAANLVSLPSQVSTTGTYYLYVTNAAGCLGGPSSGVTATINPKPTAAISSPASVCSGASRPITATSNASSPTYSWQVSSDGGVSWTTLTDAGIYSGTGTATLAISNTTGLGGYYYRYTVTSGSNCSSTSTAAIIVEETAPTISTQPSDATVSSSSTASFTAAIANSPTADFQWQISTDNGNNYSNITDYNTYSGVNSTTLVISSAATSQNGYKFRVVISNSCNTLTSNAATLTVNSCTPPTISGVTGTLTICSGVTTTLTASSNAVTPTYKWYTASSGGTLLYTGSAYTTSALTTTTTFYVDVTESGGCTSVSRTGVTVTVNPLPTISGVSGTLTVCSGVGTTLTASSSASTPTYSWYDASSGGTLLATSATYNTGALTTTTTYYVSVTDGNSCTSSSRTATTVTVNPLPTISGVSGTLTVCSGVGTTLTASSSASTPTYNWYAASSGGTALATSATYNTGALTTTTTYYVSVTDGNSCTSSARTSTTVTVNSLPTISSVSGTLTVCSGVGTTLTTSSSASTPTYNWYDASSGGTLLATSATYNTGALTTTTTYYVSVTDGNSCTSSTRFAQAVTVNPLPTISGVSGTLTVCSGVGTTLTASSSASTPTYSWYAASSGGTALATSATYNTGALTTTTTYYVSVTDGNSCTSSARTSTTVTVNALPTISGVSGTLTVCSGVGTTLTASSSSATPTYNWYNASSGGTPLATSATYNTGALTTTTTYYVSVTDGNSCTSSSRFAQAVTVNPLPTISGVSGTLTVCSGVGTTLTASSSASTPTYSWYAASSGGTALVTSATYNTGALTTTTTYYVSVTDGNSCTSSSRTSTTVTVNPLPTISGVSGTLTVCSGVGTTLTASSSASTPTYSWYAASSGGTSLATSATYNTGALITPTTYYVSVTDGNSCTSSSRTATTVTVNPLPTISGVSGTLTVCSGVSTTLTVSSSASTPTYSWYAASSGGTALATSATYNTGALTTTTTYYVSVTDGNSCTSSARTSTTVTVNPLPTISSVSGTLTVCSGVGTTLTTSSSASTPTYNWYDASSGGTLLATSATYNTGALTATTTYYVSVTDGNSCTSSSRTATTVTVNPLPTISGVSGTLTVCSGVGTTLTASSSASTPTYSWYAASSGGTALATSATYNTGALTTTTTYYVSVTDGNSCTSSSRTGTTVTVNPLPTISSVSGTLTVCSGVGTTLTASSSASTPTYNWYDASSGGTLLVTSATYNTGALTTTTTYYVSVTDGNSCTSSSRTATTVTVNPLPTISGVSGTLTVCSGVGTTLTGSSSASTPTYNWYDASSGGTLLATSATYNTGALTTTTTYYVSVTDGNSCTSSARTSTTVTVNPLPTISGVSGTLTVCSGVGTTLTASSSASTPTYNWYDASSGGTLLATSATYNTGALTTTTTYYVSVTDGNSCTSSSRTATTVTINPLPAIGLIANNGPLCTGATLNLTTGTISGASYSWTGPNGFTSNLQNPVIAAVSTANAGAYSLTATLNGCTSSITSTNVIINTLPVITVSPSSPYVVYGYGVVLTASGANTYSWSPSATLSASNTAIITATPLATTSYVVSGTNTVTGCVSSTTVTVTVGSQLNPDFGITNANVSLSGNVSTNDVLTGTNSYGTPIAKAGNPSVATLVMNNNGTYTFTAATPGVYNYYVPVCPSGQSAACPVTLLQITVLDPLIITNPPVANPDIAKTAAGTAVVINPLSNDRCANPNCSLNNASLSVVTQPVNGTVVVNTDGTITYTPANGFTGTDSIYYKICDNNVPAACANAWIYITVVPSGTASLTTAADDYGFARQGNAVSGNILNNDRNTQGATLTITTWTTPAASKGNLVINTDGSYTFTPAADFTGPLDIPYTVCGGTPQSCANATLHVLISPTYHRPIQAVNDDFSSTGINGAKGGSTPGVLTNDKLNNAAVNAADVNITIVSNGGLTGVTIDASGILTVPANTFEGTYTVTYSICEKADPANCSQAVVTVNVIRGLQLSATAVCINDVPYIQYTVTPNFTAATNPVTLTWYNGDKSQVTAQPVSNGLALSGRILWPGAVVDANGKGTDWPGWYLQNGQWVQGADGFEKTRPDAYMVISVNPTDTIKVSYPPATPACNAAPPAIVIPIDPGKISKNDTICVGTVPAAFSSVTPASGGNGSAINYQWQQSTDSLNFTNISGAVTATYTAPALSQKTYFRRMASANGNESVYSNIVAVTTVNPPQVLAISGPCAMPKDSIRTFTVSPAVPAADHYVWTVPAGYSGSSTTNSIDVKSGTVNGTIKVVPYNGSCVGNEVSYAVSVIDYAKVTITGLPVTASGNNNNPVKVTIQLYDPNGNKINCSGGVATLCSNSGVFTAVVDNNDGTYVSQLTSPANDVTICGTVAGIPILQKTKVTFTGPQGSIKGNGPILATETPKLTFTMTAGRAPFTVVYKSARSNKNDTLTNYTSGTPVPVALIPATTLYTLVSVRDANGEYRINNFTRDTATVVVVAPKVVITLHADPPKLDKDSSWGIRLLVRTKNIGDLDLSSSQARLNLNDVFPSPVTYLLDSVRVSGTTVVPNRNYDGVQATDLFARVNRKTPDLFAKSSLMNQDPSLAAMPVTASPDGSVGLDLWNDDPIQTTGDASQLTVVEDGHSVYMFGPLSNLPVGVEADVVLWLHIKPNGYSQPFVMQAVALGTGKTDEGIALATSISNDDNDVNLHPQITDKGTPVPTVISLAPLSVMGAALTAGTPVLQGNGTYNVLLSYKLKNYGTVNLKNVKLFQNLVTAIAAPSSFTLVGGISATNNLVPNPAYDGRLDTNLLVANSVLGLKQEASVQFTINITPNQLSAVYRLQALVSGYNEDQNLTVTDLSTDGTDPDPDNNLVPSEKVITVITINKVIPPLVPGNIGIKDVNTTVLTKAYCSSATAVSVIPVSADSGGLDPYQYKWQSSADNTSFTDIIGSEDSVYTSGQVNNSFYLRRVTISGNHVKYSNAVYIQINPLPAKPLITASGPLTLPVNGSVTLTSSAVTGNLWSNGAVANSIIVNAGAVGAYAVTVTDVNGCSRGSDTSRIVPPPPSVTDATYIIGSVSNPVNSGVQVSPYNGTVTGSGPALRFYTVSAGGVFIPVPVLPSTPGVYTYYVSQVINGIESALVPYKVTMLDPVKVADLHKVLSSPPVLQADGSFLVGFTLYVINLRNELLDTVRLKDDLTKVFPAYAGFQVVDVSASGKLKANPLFNGSSQTALLSDVSQLPGMQTDSVKIKLKVIPNGFNGTLNNVAELTAKSPYGLITVRSDDTTQMRTTSGTGQPVRMATPFTIPLVDIFIPEGFSPNRDGTNDLFVITRPYTVTIHLEIYNRWGNLVYKAGDYKNDWDGRGNQSGRIGDELPDGTYYYLIQATDKNTGSVRKFTGFITLKR